MNEVRRQPWLKNFDWDALAVKSIPSPYIPPNEDNFSQKVVTEPFRDENDDKFKENLALIDKPKFQSLFEGFYYDFRSTPAPIKNHLGPQLEDDNDKSNPEIHEDNYYIPNKSS